MADKSAPKPGHFLPGGEGEQGAKADESQRGPTPDPAAPPMPRFVGGAEPLAAPTPRLGGDAPATPPQLSGTRIEPKRSGSRFGSPPPEDPAAAAYRAVFHPEPNPFIPKKRSKALVAAIVVGALVVVGGGVTFAAKVLSSADGMFENPMVTPSVRTPGAPTEPTGKPTPDAEVVKQNPLYTAGKLPVVKCQEPAYKPTSMENVKAYYEGMIACLDKAWKPIVEKAGFEFRSPRLIVFDIDNETACGVQSKDIASYCQDEQGGSVTMPWQGLVDDYAKNKAATRADMAQSIGFVYGAHLQNLVGIFDASDNLRDTAANVAAQLEQDRRASLQANCLSAVFFGAAKASFPLRGELLRQWTWLIQHSGDEHSKDKTRDHGSAKSLALWMNQGFASTDPGTCNTFVAASAKVS
jgi:predicted metalloprotease